MRPDHEYFKFKAKIWRNFGFAMSSCIGIIMMNFILTGFHFSVEVLIAIVLGLLSLIFGFWLIYHSLDIMEKTYGHNRRS